MADMDDFEDLQRQLAGRIREGTKTVYNYQEMLIAYFPATAQHTSEHEFFLWASFYRLSWHREWRDEGGKNYEVVVFQVPSAPRSR